MTLAARLRRAAALTASRSLRKTLLDAATVVDTHEALLVALGPVLDVAQHEQQAIDYGGYRSQLPAQISIDMILDIGAAAKGVSAS